MKYSLILTTVLASTLLFADEASNVSTNALPHKKGLREAVGGFIIQPLPPDAKYITVVDKRETKDAAADKFIAFVVSRMGLATRTGEAKEGDIVITLGDKGDSVVYLDKAAAYVTPGVDADATGHKLMAALIRIIGIDGDKFSPQVMGTALTQARSMGIGQVRRATYKKACEEGWAPEPKDEFQKAVWEKVKAKKVEAEKAPVAAPAPEAPAAK